MRWKGLLAAMLSGLLTGSWFLTGPAAAGTVFGAEPPVPGPVRIDPAEGAKAAFARRASSTPCPEPYVVAGEKWLHVRVNEFPEFGSRPFRWMTFYAIAPSTG